MNMLRKAVLFDLDGTLLDTLADLADATNAALAKLGLPGHPLQAYKYFVGDGMENLVRRVLGQEPLDKALLARGIELTQNEYAGRWAEKTRPYPGIPDLLDGLSRRGIPMAVFSNKPNEFTQLCVTRLLPDWHFQAVQGATPDLPRKPDPRVPWQLPCGWGSIRAKSFISATRTPTCRRRSRQGCSPSARCGDFGRRKSCWPPARPHWRKYRRKCSTGYDELASHPTQIVQRHLE